MTISGSTADAYPLAASRSPAKARSPLPISASTCTRQSSPAPSPPTKVNSTFTPSPTAPRMPFTSRPMLAMASPSPSNGCLKRPSHPPAPPSMLEAAPRAGKHSEKPPTPCPRSPFWVRLKTINYCKQLLYQHRGETTTTWNISGDPSAEQTLLTSVHHAFPEKNSLEVATANIQKAQARPRCGDLPPQPLPMVE